MLALYDQITFYRLGTSLFSPLPWTLRKGDIVEAQWYQVSWEEGTAYAEAMVTFQQDNLQALVLPSSVGMLVQKAGEALNAIPSRILIRDGMTQLHWMFAAPSEMKYALGAIRLYRACGCGG